LDGAATTVLGDSGGAGSAGPAILRHLDRGALAVAAEIIGVIEGALAITVQYAKDRIQFGSPIGRYQGVKHPLAEMYVDVECLKSLTYHAAWALDDSPHDVPTAVAEAKAFGAVAVTQAGISAIQLHGAVGYTEEYDIQLYLKRSKWARPLFGDENHHQDRIATLGGY
jgi:alkylation response protein AidB-like acyl-CoA dehydrogenase